MVSCNDSSPKDNEKISKRANEVRDPTNAEIALLFKVFCIIIPILYTVIRCNYDVPHNTTNSYEDSPAIMDYDEEGNVIEEQHCINGQKKD